DGRVLEQQVELAEIRGLVPPAVAGAQGELRCRIEPHGEPRGRVRAKLRVGVEPRAGQYRQQRRRAQGPLVLYVERRARALTPAASQPLAAQRLVPAFGADADEVLGAEQRVVLGADLGELL